jgi:Cyclo-malto-dextrinase C-terminal domain./Alpha amylase, catalytic domain.
MAANDFLYANPANLVTFPDNHDMSRFYTQVGFDRSLLELGLAYVSTFRGIPQIYYGTEVLMANPADNDDHGIIRSDFPGGWVEDRVSAFSGLGLSKEQRETQGFVKKLLNWRKQNEVIHKGKLVHYFPEDGVYVYFRVLGAKKVMVLLNRNETNTVY